MLIMFSDKILERIFAHSESHKVPIGYQSTMIHIVEDVLEELKGENPYASISELLPTNADV